MCDLPVSVITREAWPECGTHCKRSNNKSMTDRIMQQLGRLPAGDHVEFLLIGTRRLS